MFCAGTLAEALCFECYVVYVAIDIAKTEISSEVTGFRVTVSLRIRITEIPDLFAG